MIGCEARPRRRRARRLRLSRSCRRSCFGTRCAPPARPSSPRSPHRPACDRSASPPPCWRPRSARSAPPPLRRSTSSARTCERRLAGAAGGESRSCPGLERSSGRRRMTAPAASSSRHSSSVAGRRSPRLRRRRDAGAGGSAALRGGCPVRSSRVPAAPAAAPRPRLRPRRADRGAVRGPARPAGGACLARRTGPPPGRAQPRRAPGRAAADPRVGRVAARGLLVDDVITTGATLAAAAAMLRAGGCERVEAAVFARAPPGPALHEA